MSVPPIVPPPSARKIFGGEELRRTVLYSIFARVKNGIYCFGRVIFTPVLLDGGLHLGFCGVWGKRGRGAAGAPILSEGYARAVWARGGDLAEHGLHWVVFAWFWVVFVWFWVVLRVVHSPSGKGANLRRWGKGSGKGASGAAWDFGVDLLHPTASHPNGTRERAQRASIRTAYRRLASAFRHHFSFVIRIKKKASFRLPFWVFFA